MKKVLGLVLALLMVVPMSFAQQTSGLENTLKRKIVEVQGKTAEDIARKQVLKKLDDVRSLVMQSKREDPSAIMQGVLELSKQFSVYKVASNQNMAGLIDLAQQIERPIRPGWLKQEKMEMFVVSQKIDEFVGVYSHEWGSREPTDELMKFGEELKLYSIMRNKQDLQAYNRMMSAKRDFFQGVNNMSARNAAYASNVSQLLIELADSFFNSVPCAENQALGKLVLQELNEPVTIAGQTKKLAAWARQNNEWPELEKFADALEKSSR